MTVLCENVNMGNPLAAGHYTQSLNSALALGHSITDAQSLATNTLYSIVQVQALMLALKTLVGYLLIAAIIIMVVSRFIPFHQKLKVKVVKTGDDMV